MKIKSACILNIGDELLTGKTVNTNASWLAQQLYKRGVEVERILVLPDQMKVLVKEIRNLSSKYDYLLITGGLGPTPDDLTRQAVAKALRKDLISNKEALERIKEFYLEEGQTLLSMADLPEGAEIIPNKVTGVPGFYLQNIYCFAGVPSILKNMFSFLTDNFKSPPVFSKERKTFLREEDFNHILEKTYQDFPQVKIGSYPHFDEQGQRTSVLVIFHSRKEKELEKAFSLFTSELKELERLRQGKND